MKTSKPTQERIRLLVDELRTTQLKKHKGTLKHPTEEKYCVLGIATLVAIRHGVKVRVGKKSGEITFDDEWCCLPDKVQRWYGFPNPFLPLGETTATDYNDGSHGRAEPFRKIADRIEKEYLT